MLKSVGPRKRQDTLGKALQFPTMDLKLVIFVAVLALVSVEARSKIRCPGLCKYGYFPGTCKCRVQPTNPCAFTLCPTNTRCVPRGPVADCVPIDVCRQPKEPGPCKARMPRYYYNSASGRCEKFFYGGCLGNGNNFKTLRDCNSQCSRPHSYY